MVKSMLDLRQLESFAKSPAVNHKPVLHPDPDLGSTISLQTIAGWVIRHAQHCPFCMKCIHESVTGGTMHLQCQD